MVLRISFLILFRRFLKNFLFFLNVFENGKRKKMLVLSTIFLCRRRNTSKKVERTNIVFAFSIFKKFKKNQKFFKKVEKEQEKNSKNHENLCSNFFSNFLADFMHFFAFRTHDFCVLRYFLKIFFNNRGTQKVNTHFCS
jgi:hypothetical protein